MIQKQLGGVNIAYSSDWIVFRQTHTWNLIVMLNLFLYKVKTKIIYYRKKTSTKQTTIALMAATQTDKAVGGTTQCTVFYSRTPTSIESCTISMATVYNSMVP